MKLYCWHILLKKGIRFYILLTQDMTLHSCNILLNKKVILKISLAQGMTLYCCYHLLNENDNYNDSCNVDFYSRHISLQMKDIFQNFLKCKGHEIILLVHFVKKRVFLIQGMTFHWYHNLLTGNDNFHDFHNVEGFDRKLQALN